ncbi:MAG: amidase [Anaerolineales bacterium]|nr:amidase [Anaerolineales bacterium]
MTNLTAPPADLPALAHALRTGRLALAAYLDYLEARFAEREPGLRAYMPEPERFARLRAEAVALEAHYPDPGARPPLYGVPVGVKDIFHVDGLPTTAGSRLPPEALAGPQAEAVTALRHAGALVLGKTVSTEFAFFGPGPTRNPHNAAHTPGGSSSGSAAAVAAGLGPLTLGTQTIGSIIRPAAFCGVVGYKPSYARISAAGVIPLSPSLDHVGLFTPDVPGAALAAGVLCAEWRPAVADRQPVIGVPAGPYLDAAGEAAQAHLRQVMAQLLAAGCQVRPVPALADFEAVRERHWLLLAAEAAQVHAAWFPAYGQLYHPRTADLVARGRAADPEAVEAACHGRADLRADLTRLMDDHGLDLWIAPSALGPAPLGLESTGDPVMNLPWTHAGLPAVGVPAGSSADGLPLGVQFIGRWWADEQLLAWAAPLAQQLA